MTVRSYSELNLGGENLVRFFKHYKGGEYKLLCKAKHTETQEDLAVYKDINGQVWVRPYEMFRGKVEVNGKKIPRFREITSLSYRKGGNR